MHGSSEPDLRNCHLQTQPGRIQPIDSSQLANGADNPQGRAQNRRVEFVLPKR
ncbi:hypothetical protein L565_1035 [Bordetella pertussis CHLA-20]|nr:hypothetical protein [Bordetella pertussis]ETH26237.1 hypothetical protein L565_1035 [Bordetella pertussis CHLA-20]ETH75428.1 hypothetical protein L555_1066 [Bordetella pertussis STO1-CHOC-0008]